MNDTRRNYRGKLWLGEYPLGGKTILLHAEQGLGDTIQFARYVPLLGRAPAPRWRWKCSRRSKPCSRPCPAPFPCMRAASRCPLTTCIARSAACRWRCKTAPDTFPPKSPISGGCGPHRKWRPALAALPGKRVAFAWAGHARSSQRQQPLAGTRIARAAAGARTALPSSACSPICAGRGRAEWPGLRVTATSAASGRLRRHRRGTFACDLTLAVDTALVHLAGAMARPVWILLPFAPDWRWTLSRERSPWYPQARLFRQPLRRLDKRDGELPLRSPNSCLNTCGFLLIWV